MNTYQLQLKEITGILLEKEDAFDRLSKAIDGLMNLFSSVSSFEIDTQENREDIHLSSGKAIGSTWAAMCIKEHLRTKRFIAGLYSGIKEAQKRFPGTPIHILYAGTGPFATLALPMTTEFSSDEINFTFLEINPQSIEYLQKVIDAFKVRNYVKGIHQCDAAAFSIQGMEPVHIVLTETMQNGLKKEPHVAITMNLLPQMHPDGILIPQEILIEAGLINNAKNADRVLGKADNPLDYLKILGKVFELNKSSAKKYLNCNRELFFPEKEIDVPSGVEKNYDQLSLLTTIRVFEDIQLDHWQCSLNLPLKILNLNSLEKPLEKICFQYVSNATPGFKYRII